MATFTVNIVGNLAADPELRYTAGGDPVASMRVIVNHRRYDGNVREWVDDGASGIDVTAWKRLGENAAAQLHKGQEVFVTGRAKIEEFQRRDGTEGRALKVTADALGPNLRWRPRESTPAPQADPWGSRPTQDQYIQGQQGGAQEGVNFGAGEPDPPF